MNLQKFLTKYLNHLKTKKIPYCILRNYEGLPEENYSNDIDILIRPNDKLIAIKELSTLNEISITDISERPYVTSIFIKGIIWGSNNHSIQVDLITSLSWKGLSYLSVKDVLTNAKKLRDDNDIIIVPDRYHEAINSFFSSYLIGGWIKEKYQKFVREAFINDRTYISFLLRKNFEAEIIDDLIDRVCDNDHDRLILLLPKLRRSLALNNFKNSPVNFFKSIIKHYSTEVLYRFTPLRIHEICIMGSDGVGKSSVISKSKYYLKNTTKSIISQHLKPNFFINKKNTGPITKPHEFVDRSGFSSFLKLFAWLLEYWIGQFFHGYKNVTLRIWDRYYHDILVDPHRYRYGSSLWMANFFAKIVPQPELWIFLTAPPEIIQSRKQEVSLSEIKKQQKRYVNLAKKYSNSVVIDSSLPLDKVAEYVSSEIINHLEKKTQKYLSLKIDPFCN